jgi:hypothetical protein
MLFLSLFFSRNLADPNPLIRITQWETSFFVLELSLIALTVPATRETSRTISATAREFTPGPKSKAISNHFQELMNIQKEKENGGRRRRR